jgi:hypothetical protein
MKLLDTCFRVFFTVMAFLALMVVLIQPNLCSAFQAVFTVGLAILSWWDLAEGQQ